MIGVSFGDELVMPGVGVVSCGCKRDILEVAERAGLRRRVVEGILA